MLIKDKNNEYWKLGIAPIRVKYVYRKYRFISISEPSVVEKYREGITEAYKKLDLKSILEKKISEKRYFNINVN